jgi:hypothetical protein
MPLYLYCVGVERMPIKKKIYRRVQSTPTQIDANASTTSEGASHRSPLSDPIFQSCPSIPPQVEEESNPAISLHQLPKKSQIHFGQFM